MIPRRRYEWEVSQARQFLGCGAVFFEETVLRKVAGSHDDIRLQLRDLPDRLVVGLLNELRAEMNVSNMRDYQILSLVTGIPI